MTDKEILEEVYRKLETAVGGDAVAIRRFIEQEWQRADDKDNNTPKLYAIAKLWAYKQQLKDMVVMDDYDGGKAAMLREVIEDLEKGYVKRG